MRGVAPHPPFSVIRERRERAEVSMPSALGWTHLLQHLFSFLESSSLLFFLLVHIYHFKSTTIKKETFLHLHSVLLSLHKLGQLTKQNCQKMLLLNWLERPSFHLLDVLVFHSKSHHNIHVTHQRSFWTVFTEFTIYILGDMKELKPDVQQPLELVVVFSHSVLSDSFVIHGLQPARLLYPWHFLGKNTVVAKFIAALFTIARTWKQPRYSSTDEWIKKLWYIYTMEYQS